MACGTLHLVPPPLVRPAYSKSRTMMRADCYWLNPFLRLIKQCCSRQNKIYFILKPLKAQCRPMRWDILCAIPERNSNNLSLALSLFGIKTAKTSNKRLQLAARFHIYKLCYVTSLLVSFPIVNEVNCISGAKNWLPSLFLSKVVLSVGWVDRIILRIEINQF